MAPAGQVLKCRLVVRFLDEATHAVVVLPLRRPRFGIEFDVPVAGFGPRRRDAESDDRSSPRDLGRGVDNRSESFGIGDEERAQLARIFVDTVPDVLRVMHTCIVNGDFDAVLADVIFLKGAVASIEAPGVLHFVSLLEQHARNRDPLATVGAFAMVQAVTERLVDELASLAAEASEVIEPNPTTTRSLKDRVNEATR